ncbi:I78 family peptidase inhibitor [Maricaulis maris]|uniref:Peptidase inhibitor I78 family protein n=1 Tax=Maricaulis maris TaxID=74318 RepID=A0A495D4Q2_9PROT|nr:I78 family peptidase inhibitor [Maricaulis maris]RKQ95531.1 peptidase inhibitor I78 family protein [Maricaulis maris]
MKAHVIILSCLLAGCGLTTGGATSTDERQLDALPPLGSTEDVDGGEVRAPITGTCGMENLQHFVGRPRVTVPASAMPENYRVVGPNSVVTMDYRPDRLTVRVDENDVVESLACG